MFLKITKFYQLLYFSKNKDELIDSAWDFNNTGSDQMYANSKISTIHGFNMIPVIKIAEPEEDNITKFQKRAREQKKENEDISNRLVSKLEDRSNKIMTAVRQIVAKKSN